MRNLWIGILSISLIAGWTGLENGAFAAESFPVKPITFIIPLEAGSDGDILARPLCQKVSAILGQPVLIVNKPGAGSSIGYREIGQYLQGKMTLEEAVYKIKTGTHRFIRHQYAWFRLDDNRIKWFDIRQPVDSEITALVGKFLGVEGVEEGRSPS